MSGNHTAERLFMYIAHGDDEHRAWLKKALECFFENRPVPLPRVSLPPKESALVSAVWSALDDIEYIDGERFYIERSSVDELTAALAPYRPKDSGPSAADIPFL